MKKLLILLFLILASFSTFADGHHLRDFSLSDFCYEQPNVQNRNGVYYFPNHAIGITDTSICVYKDAYNQYASRGNLVRGVFDGLWTGWTRNGEMSLETYYINGKVVPIVCRDDLLEFDKDETYFDLYDEPLTGYNRCTDEDKVITGEIINGKREGFWSIFIHSNKEFIKANYLNGKYNGVVAKGYHTDSVSSPGWSEIITTTDENFKDGKCVSSNVLKLGGNDGWLPCSGEDEQAEQDLARQLIIEDQLNTLKSAYINNIVARVYSYWRYQGSEDGWGCEVYVQQDRDGTVEAVNVQNCTLDDSALAKSFRNSIERAVYKASPLPAAPDDAVFDREILFYFRAIK